LRDAIARLLDDEPARRRLGSRASEVARERFGDDRMVERMLAVFRQATASHG